MRKFPIRSLMRGLWADLHECEVESTDARSTLHHRGEHVLDATVFMNHDRTVSFQASKQGITVTRKVEDWDRDVPMAAMLTVLYVWKERFGDGAAPPFERVYDCILKTLRSDPPNGTGWISPSLCLLLDAAEERHREVTGELEEKVRERLAEAMGWLRDRAGLNESGLLKMWREGIVRSVLED